MIQIKKSSLIVALAALMLFRPSIIMQYPALDLIVSLIVNLISILVLFLWVLKGLKNDTWIISTGIFFVTLIVITIANQGETTYIFSAIKIFVAILIWKVMTKTSPDRFLFIIKDILFVLVLLNLVSMIFFPEGIIQLHRVASEWDDYYVGWWLFGNKNTMILWIYALNVLAQISLCRENEHRKIYSIDIWMIIATVLTAFFCKSSTTIVVIVLLSIVPIIWEKFNLWSFVSAIHPFMILIGYLIFFIILITSTQFGLFEMVTNLFDKDVTFTGRTSAWAKSVILIANKPWFGYGVLSSERLRSLLGAFAFVNAHNTLLQTLIDGGIVLGIQYLAIIYLLCKKIVGLDISHIKEKNILLIAIAILTIAISFEAYTENLMFWNILSLIYYTTESIQNDDYCS